MFGENGKEILDKMVMDKDFQESSLSSDIRKLQEEYMDRIAKRLGNDIAKVIEFETLNEMEFTLCKICPLYEKKKEFGC